MPVSLLSYHAHGPMTDEGEPRLVLQSATPRPERLPLAERYRRALQERIMLFDANHQRRLIDLVIDNQHREGYRCFAVATNDTRVEVLAAWSTDCPAADLRARLRARLIRGMNREFGRTTWFGDGGSAKRVRNRAQFDYLLNTRLPERDGLVWTATRGFAARARTVCDPAIE